MSHLSLTRLVALSSAEVLAELSCQIEALGADLCADPVVTLNHMTTLQAIDQISQKLSSLSGLLSSEDPAGAAEKLQLEELRTRFSHLAIS